MQNLKAAYCNELYKISKKKKIVVAAVLSIFAVLVGAFFVTGINSISGIRTTGGSDFVIFVMQVLNYTLIPLFTAFVCIDMFSGEFHDQTIKQTLTRPISRYKVFWSKVLAAATFIAVNLLFVLVVSSVAAIFVKGSGFDIGKVLISYLVSFFPLLTFALLVVMISNLARGSASAFMLSILIFLVFKGLELVVGPYQSFLFTSAFDWYTLFIGSFVNVQKIIRVALILIGYDIMLFAFGYYLFDRRNF